MDLKGKVAIVTGAGQGIGEVIARRLSGEGAAIVEYLCSDRASYVTGATIDVNGAILMR